MTRVTNCLAKILCAWLLTATGVWAIGEPTSATSILHIKGVPRSTILRQKGNLTYLETSTHSHLEIPLSKQGPLPQGLDAPIEAEKVASIQDEFIAFTVTYASNPGNIQGQCGANLSGEVYLHVVALGAAPHETLSTIVESCLLRTLPAHYPEWNSKARTLKMDYLRNEGGPLHIIYHVGTDGSVH